MGVSLTTCKASFSSVNVMGLSRWIIRQILSLILAALNWSPDVHEPAKALCSNQYTCDKKKNYNACNNYTSNSATWKTSWKIILLNICYPIGSYLQSFFILSWLLTAVEPEFNAITLSSCIVCNALSCLVSTAFAAASIAAVWIYKRISHIIWACGWDWSTDIVSLIEIISQKYIEFFSCFVALFGEYKCRLVSFQVTNITNHVAVLEPLSICKAPIAIAYGLCVDSWSLQGLVEASLHVESVAELCALEAWVVLVLNGVNYHYWGWDSRCRGRCRRWNSWGSWWSRRRSCSRRSQRC